jgi:hypothetical protein
VSWSGNPAFSIKEIPRDSCSSTRLGTHRYSGDDSQSGSGTQANTYSDRTRPQGASSDPGEGARHSTSCLQRGTERAIRSRWSGHGATSPRASNSLKRSLPRKHVSSIYCPVTSSASRLVLLNWPPPDHLWIGTKSRHVLLPQRVTNARASIPAETAAQTRIVSVAGIRLDHRKSVRPFKGIFCHDISEFESYIASQAVGLWPLPSGGSAWCPSARISIPQVITMFYDAACEVHHEHFSRIADRWVRRPKSDLELLDRSCLDDSVSAWVGNRLKTR